MLKQLREYLSSLNWQEGETPPVVDLDIYFDGNTEEECIAPNQWGDGRPPIADLYGQFQQIAQHPSVERVLVGLHSDWNHPDFADTFPPAENVHVITTSGKAELESWLTGLHSDGVLKGWPYGKPKNAPEPSKGYTVFSVCWD